MEPDADSASSSQLVVELLANNHHLLFAFLEEGREVFDALVAFRRRIRRLELHGESKVTERWCLCGFALAVESMQLEALVVHGRRSCAYSSITGRDTPTVFHRQFRPLRSAARLVTLKLRFVPITDALMCSVALNCVALREVDLTRSTDVRYRKEAAIHAYNRERSHVESSFLTEKGIGALLRLRVATLESVNLTRCPLQLDEADIKTPKMWYSSSKLMAWDVYDALDEDDLDDMDDDSEFSVIEGVNAPGRFKTLVLDKCSCSTVALAALRLLSGDCLTTLSINGLFVRPCDVLPMDADESTEDALEELVAANSSTLLTLKCGERSFGLSDGHQNIGETLLRGLSSDTLQTLDLSGIDLRWLEGDYLVPCLRSLPSLKVLKLESCQIGEGMTDEEQDDDDDDDDYDPNSLHFLGRCLGSLTLLTVLRLDGNPALGRPGKGLECVRFIFTQISSGELPHLLELGLSGVFCAQTRRPATPDEIQEDLEWAAEWGHRHDDDDKYLEPAVLRLFEDDMGRLETLQVLDLSGNRLRAADLARVPQLCPSLREVRVGVAAGRGRCGPGKEEFTDLDAAAFLNDLRLHCPSLQRLELHHPDYHFDDTTGTSDGIGRALDALLGPQITHLAVTGKGRPGDGRCEGAWTDDLAQRCPRLRYLDVVNLYSSDRDSDDHWLKIAQALPGCTVHAVSGHTYQRGRLIR